MGQRHNRRRTRLRPRNRSHSPDHEESDLRDPISPSLAPSWHYGSVTGPTRRPLLETEQCRLFGGVPGDDVSLCHRMLEYFGGLDYIDS